MDTVWLLVRFILAKECSTTTQTSECTGCAELFSFGGSGGDLLRYDCWGTLEVSNDIRLLVTVVTDLDNSFQEGLFSYSNSLYGGCRRDFDASIFFLSTSTLHLLKVDSIRLI